MIDWSFMLATPGRQTPPWPVLASLVRVGRFRALGYVIDYARLGHVN